MDNASDSDSEDQEFKSLWAGHDYLPIWHQTLKPLDIQGVSAFLEGVFSSGSSWHQISYFHGLPGFEPSTIKYTHISDRIFQIKL